jgi:WD40 repeat protein
VALLDGKSHGPLGTLPGQAQSGSLLAVAFSPKGDLLAAASNDGTVALWTLPDRRPLGPPLQTGQKVVRALAFSPDGATLATGGSDQTVRLWNARARTAACGEPLPHDETVTSLAFSPDGQLLASGSRDTLVRVWDLASCPAHSHEPLGRHRDEVVAVRFRADGQVLASAGRDATVMQWDVRAGLLLGLPHTVESHERRLVKDRDRDPHDGDSGPARAEPVPLTALVYGPDGLLVAGNDEGLWLWDTEVSVALACARANRNLSAAEWRRFIGNTAYCRVCENLPAGQAAPPAAGVCKE